MMKFLFMISLISCLFSIRAEVSIKQYETQYPVFNQQNAREEAQKIVKNKFSPISIGTEVEIKTKLGQLVKGKYKGINLGNVIIGNSSISFIDIPDETLYLFSEAESKKRQEEFVSNYLEEVQKQYLAKKCQDMADFKKSFLAAKKAEEITAINSKKSSLTARNGIELANGDILYSVEIIKKSFDSVSIKSGNNTIDYKFTQLSPISRELIKSDFGFTTLDNVTYKNVQVIETDISTVKFYNEQGEIEVINFKRLPAGTQTVLGYSAAKEAEYERQQKKEAEIAAANERQQKKEAEIAATKREEAEQQKRQNSWIKYRNLCGNKAQETNASRAKDNFNKIYKDKSIVWSGTIFSINNDGLDRMEAYCELVVRVKMSPSDSFLADLQLRFPKKFKDQLLELNKGDTITFTGKINSMGGTFSDHEIEIYNFKAYRCVNTEN